MNEFIWHDDYQIGHPPVDQQHHHLFELANQIVAANDTDTLTEYTMLLYRHVREHFQCEESLMKQYGYPCYDEHVVAHNDMLDKLVTISGNLRNRNANNEEILVFMREWVLVHILKMDMILGDYLRHRGMPASFCH